MSTSAIIRAIDSEGNDWAIYTPSDGYPDFLGKFLKAFIKTAPRIDPKSPFYKGAPSNPSLKWCLITRSPDVSLLASRFLTGFIGYFMRVGHSSLYLTRRDPIEEQMNGCTDVDYYYIVQLNGKGKIKMRIIPRRRFKFFAKKSGMKLFKEVKI